MLTATYPSWSGNLGSKYTYGYDTMGRLNTLTDTRNTRTLVSGMTYGVANEVLGITSGYTTGVNSEAHTFNSMFELTRLQVASALDISYNYSGTQNNGEITSESDALSGEQVAYTYDALNRLASAQTTQPGGTQWGLGYNYDGFGNLTDQNFIKGSVPTMHVTYNASNNLQTGDTADLNGNIGAGYIYDIDNRLVQPGSSATAHYGYDTGNKRVWRGDTSSGLDEITFWAGKKLATYQVSSSGGVLSFALTSTRVYFGGKMISTGTYVSFGSSDKVALAPVVADRQGSIKKFYPFCVERPSASANDTEKFTGYYRDASTGLDYADQRYEQPGAGRFMTPDPKGGSAQANGPGSWNRYAYVKGDPINSTDPSGLDSDDLYWYSNPGFAPSINEDLGVGYELPGQVYQEALYAYSTFGGCPSDPSALLNTFSSSRNVYYEGAYDACAQTPTVPVAFQAVPSLIVVKNGSDCYLYPYRSPGFFSGAQLAERDISYLVLDQAGAPIQNAQIREVLTPINGAGCPNETTVRGGKCYGDWVTGTFNDAHQIRPNLSLQSYYQSFEVQTPGFDNFVPISAYNSEPAYSIRIDKRPWLIYINGNDGNINGAYQSCK